jgi:pimeloyl-ACP methyl ester carboxylesterase
LFAIPHCGRAGRQCYSCTDLATLPSPFDEAFSRNECADFDLIAPDLPGHECSLAAHNGVYSLESLASCLHALIEAPDLRRLTVVGHSLSGDIATVLASTHASGRLERLVSIEGTIAPADLFICNRASEAADRGFGAFETWFREQYCEETVFEGWARQGDAGRRYHASLRFCNPDAFLACAAELYARNRQADARGLSGIGALYAALPMEKRFIYGTRSLPKTTAKLIAELGIESHALPAGHWVMVDAASQFYPLLRQIILG